MIADIGMGYALIISSIITGAAAITTTWLQVKTRREIKPPSGGTIGEMVERSHALAAANAAGVKTLIEHAGCTEFPAEMEHGE